MSKQVRKSIRVLALLWLVGILLATTVSAAYSATIQVIESTGASYMELPILVSVDNDYLADNSYITATGLDTRVEAGGVAVPHILTEDKLLFVDSISANTTANFQYTTGNIALSGFPVITGYDGYVTISDDPALECSDNCTVELSLWVDTTAGSDKNLVSKENAFRIYVSGTDNITATVGSWADEIILEDCEDKWTQINAGSTTSLDAVDFKVGAGSAKNTQDGTGGIQLESHETIGSVDLSAFTQIMMWIKSSINMASGDMQIHLDDTVACASPLETLDIPNLSAGVWTSITLTLANPGSDTDIISIGLYSAVDKGAWVINIDDVKTAPPASVNVTATGITSGEYKVATAVGEEALYLGIGTDVVNAGFPILDSLVLNTPLWYTELNGSPFTSLDGYEHSCTVTGATWSSSGRAFDGNDFISVAVADVLKFESPTQDFTLSCWVKREVYDVIQLVLDSRDANNDGWALWLLNDNKFRASLDGVGGADITSASTITDDAWHMISFVADRTGNGQLYLDGVADGAAVDITGITMNIATGVFVGKQIFPADRFFTGEIGEIDIYDDALTPSEILHNYNSTRWSYNDSSEYFHYSSTPLNGASVPDNANDWVIMQNNVAPYMEYYKHTVSDTLIVHYQPITIISGTTLPDREGAAQNGAITWGSNPAGIAVTIGSLVSESQPAPSIVGEDEVVADIAPTITQPSNYLTGKDMSTNPFYTLVKPLADLTGFNESWIWVTFATIIVLIAMVMALGAFHNQFIAGIAGFALIALFYQMGIYPFWIIIVYTMAVVAIVVFEKVQTV